MVGDKYYSFAFDFSVSEPDQLQLEKTKATLRAVAAMADFTLIEVRANADHSSEALVIDVACDEVPAGNPVGIQFRERIALLFSSNLSKLPKVFAWRQDFPTLLHQNAAPPGNPRDLCLYFEPAIAALRTWTPQSFLQRVQWWLVQSSRGSLHAADQLPDQLFFESSFAVVLPHDFDNRIGEVGQRLVFSNIIERENGGSGAFIGEVCASNNVPANASKICVIRITVPAFPHSGLEQDPSTLGELAARLEMLGADVAGNIRQWFWDNVSEVGLQLHDAERAILIISLPITLIAGGPVQRIQHRAYVFIASIAELGRQFGALLKGHDNRFYVDNPILPGAKIQEDATWRNTEILPLEIQRALTPSLARKQSGVADAGPRATLAGVGALGSILLNLWRRCGWGEWTIIDSDYLKPHNLARHTTFAAQTGEYKVTAIAELDNRLWRGASSITAVVGDVMDSQSSAVNEGLRSAEVVVDATTTLDFPRYLSTQDPFPRSASVFVTPSGKDGVILLESSDRTLRLDALEAQYYRAVVRNDWGSAHLPTDLATMWTGAGCRDISTELAYSDVCIHAATFCEQIPRLLATSEAAIRVWVRNPINGSIAAVSPGIRMTIQTKIGSTTLVYDQGIAEELKELRRKAEAHETGGVLLGYHDLNVGCTYIVDILPAPPDSEGTSSGFLRGVEGLAEQVQEAKRRTANIVNYVGEWHSHPPGFTAAPSSADVVQLAYLAKFMHDDGLPAYMCIVSDELAWYRGEQV